MSVRGLSAGLLVLAFGAAWLGAGEAPKAPTPPSPEPAKPAPPSDAKPAPKPGKTAVAPKTSETAAQRADRLGKVYDGAELLYKDDFLREAQKAYAQVALEDPGFRRVASRLSDLRHRLEAEERRDRQTQAAHLLDAADAYFASANYEASANACESVLAIDDKNARAQRRLRDCAAELELRRRVTSVFSDTAAPGDREVVAQAKTALDGNAPADEAPPKNVAPAVRTAKDFAPAPPKSTRVVRPGENTEGEPLAPATAKGPSNGRPHDPEGSRLVGEAWDLYQSAKSAKDPRPALRKALDILTPVTPTSSYSQQTKDTASLLRSSIARRLADEGRGVSPEEARRIRLYQRFAQAEEAFRSGRFNDALAITDEILAEDKTFSLARNLNQEARIRQHDLQALETEIEHEIILDKLFAGVNAASVPPEPTPPVGRPGIDLKRPAAEIATPELEEKLNQRVSVNLIQADLDYVLDLLFRSTGVNIIYNPDVVQGKQITIHVANYPLKQLLDYIAANHGMVFSKTPDGVLITTPDQPRLETFVVPLRYGIVDVTKAPPTGGDLSKGGSAKPIDPETSSNLEQVLDKLDALTGWAQGSSYYLDRLMNIVYFRTTREDYQKVLQILDAVDQIPVNILIKAMFIEISANDFESYGVEGALTARQITTTIPDPADPTKTITSTKDDPDSRVVAKYSFPADGFPKGEQAGTITFAGVCGPNQYKLTLSALQRMGRSRVLTAPNIICMNNCTAAIAVTTTLIYIEDYEVDRSDISGSTVGSNYNPSTGLPISGVGGLSSEPILIPVFSKDEYEGFMFDVTASVGQDTRFVTLSLNPRIRTKIDEVTFDVVLPSTTTTTTAGAGSGATSTTGATNNKVTIVRPILDERSLSTKLTVADGHVVALGGMMVHHKTAVRDKIPILGDIPILGSLFTKRSYIDDRRNLLIFLECQVITPTGARYADSGRIDEFAPPPKAEPRVGLREEKAPTVRAAP